MTPPDAAAETGERRIIADGIRSYEDLLNAFRLRIREQGLAISAEANTEIAGLSDRYLQKIVGSRPVKRPILLRNRYVTVNCAAAARTKLASRIFN